MSLNWRVDQVDWLWPSHEFGKFRFADILGLVRAAHKMANLKTIYQKLEYFLVTPSIQYFNDSQLKTLETYISLRNTIRSYKSRFSMFRILCNLTYPRTRERHYSSISDYQHIHSYPHINSPEVAQITYSPEIHDFCAFFPPRIISRDQYSGSSKVNEIHRFLPRTVIESSPCPAFSGGFKRFETITRAQRCNRP